MLFGWDRPLRPGQTALVVGAGGGVASACVQLAHLAGARVLATSSTPEKLAHAAALGAEVAIDYRTEDVPKRVLAETGGAGVDLVVDNVGAATWAQSLRCVRRGGRVVTCGATTGGDPPAELQRVFIRQIQIQGSTMGSLEEFRRLLAAVAAGRLRPAVERSFALEEVPAALDHLASGGQRGKLAIRVG
jgi:NADPH:quinone reductase-like Zn-dependent oxidoreductase